MGNRGASSGKSGAGSSTKRVTQSDFNNFVDNQNPQDYLGVLAPQNVSVNGVEFQQINSYEFLGSDTNKRFVTSYQAAIPDKNGEFPVIDLVVKAAKKKGKTTYSWDKGSLSGTKMY